MKNLGKLALVLSIFLMVGCSKDNESEDMASRLPGTWNYVMELTIIGGPSSSQYGSITFTTGGSGTLTPLGGQEQVIVWTSNEDKSFTLDGDTWTNTKNEEKSQEFINGAGDTVLSLSK